MYLESKKADLAPRTYASYAMIIRKHLVPVFGQFEAQKVQPLMIENYKNEKLQLKLANRTVKYHLDILDFAFKYGQKFNIVGRNPMDKIDKPLKVKSKIQILTPSQLKDFEDYARENKYFPIYYFAVRTGMRLGEVLGLQWSSVDGKIITVANQLQRIEDEGLVLGDILKTSSSYRKLSVSGNVLNMLETLKGNSNYVFCQENGQPHEPKNVSKVFGKLASNISIKSNFHILRHTHASFLLAAGVDIIKVQMRLGHERPSTTTDLYGHLIPNENDKTGDIFETILEGGQRLGNFSPSEEE